MAYEGGEWESEPSDVEDEEPSRPGFHSYLGRV